MNAARRRAAISLCASFLLLTVACGSEDSGADDGANAAADTADEPTPALTQEEAAAVLERYSEINNEANELLDADLMATAEGGPLLQRSTAELEYQQWLPEDEVDEFTPFGYVSPEFFIPADGEPWFIATATTSESKTPRILTFAAEPSEGEPSADDWRMVSALTLREDEEFPDIELDEHQLGEAVPADEEQEPLRPEQLGTAFTDLLVTGGSGWGAHLAENEPVATALEDHQHTKGEDLTDDQELAGYTRSYQTSEPDHPEVYALRTVDGGTFTVAPRAHTLRESVTKTNANLVPEGYVAVYVEEQQASIRTFVTGEVAAHLPADGEPRVVAARARLIGAV